MGGEQESDRDLVRRFLAAGDEQAFRLLYRRHTPALYGLSLRLAGGDRERAQDAVQETWVRACRGLARFAWRSGLRTWLSGIAVHVAREEQRAADRAPQAPDVDLERASGAAEHPPVGRRDLERALAELPPGYRQVLVLRDVEGYTHREIGEMLGIDPGTSKSQLHHARRAMRALLIRGGPHDREH